MFSRLTTADFRAEVDLTGVRETRSDQVVEGPCRRPATTSRSSRSSPQLVTVTLEPVATKTVPVHANLVGAPPQGFSVPHRRRGQPRARCVSPAPAAWSSSSSSAGADVNLTGLRVSLAAAVPLTPRDASGADIRGVSIEPARADIRVGVAQQEVDPAPDRRAAGPGHRRRGLQPRRRRSRPAGCAGLRHRWRCCRPSPDLDPTEPIDVSGLSADVTPHRAPARACRPADHPR